MLKKKKKCLKIEYCPSCYMLFNLTPARGSGEGWTRVQFCARTFFRRGEGIGLHTRTKHWNKFKECNINQQCKTNRGRVTVIIAIVDQCIILSSSRLGTFSTRNPQKSAWKFFFTSENDRRALRCPLPNGCNAYILFNTTKQD